MNIRNISSLFGINKAPKDDFSDFFHNASSKEKKKLFKKVVSQANGDQKDFVERSKRLPQESSQVRN